jgi:transcriptional regulator with XRE-family HTH domain
MLFADRLKQLRLRAGFATAREFARTLDVPENRYTRWERGQAEPSLEMFVKICRLLKSSPNALLSFDPPPRPLIPSRPPGLEDDAPAFQGALPASGASPLPPLLQQAVLRFARMWAEATAQAPARSRKPDMLVITTMTARLYGEGTRDPAAMTSSCLGGAAFAKLPKAQKRSLLEAANLVQRIVAEGRSDALV